MTARLVRPRFEIDFVSDPDAVMEEVRSRLPECPHCTGMSVGRHAELFVPQAERRVWSPWLSVTAHERGDGTVLKGRFAPHPSVWTLYLFLSFGLGFALLVGTSLGYAQWATERTPWALVSIPLVGLLGMALYLASQVGQRLGAEQMDRLQHAISELTAYSR